MFFAPPSCFTTYSVKAGLSGATAAKAGTAASIAAQRSGASILIIFLFIWPVIILSCEGRRESQI